MSPETFAKVFHVKDVKGDGQCFFRAIAMGYQENEKYHARVKDKMRKWMLTKEDDALHKRLRKSYYHFPGDWEAHLRRLQSSSPTTDPALWGCDTLQPVAEAAFDIRIFIWSSPIHGNAHYRLNWRPYPHHSPSVVPKKVLHLLNVADAHYQLLVPNSNYVSSKRAQVDVHETSSVLSVSTQKSALSDSLTPSARMSSAIDDAKSISPNCSQDELKEWTQNEVYSEDEDDFTILRRRASTNSSHTSGGSRKCYNDYNRENVMCADIAQQYKTFLGDCQSVCCSKGCLRYSKRKGPSADCDSYYVMQSDIFEHAEEMLRTCRRNISLRKERERSKWIQHKYMDACRTFTAADGKQELLFSNFTVEFEASNDENALIKKDVCEKAFNFIYCVSDSMRWRIKSNIRQQKGLALSDKDLRRTIREIANEDPDTRELSPAEYYAVSFIKDYCECFGELIPNRALEVVRISFHKKHVYEAYKNTFQCEDTKDQKKDDIYKRPGKPLCDSKFYRLWNDHCAHIELARWKGDFAICDDCKRFAQIDSNPNLSAAEKKENRLNCKRHLRTVQVCRMGYYERQAKAMLHPNNYMSIIIDGCDSNTTILPNIKSRSKKEEGCSEYMLKCKLMGVRVHAMRNRDYLYLAPPFVAKKICWNYTLDCLMRTLCEEEKYRLENNLSWPTTLYLQLDNSTKDNKNCSVKAFLSYLILIGVFDEIHINYLPVGHTHEDIDQLFSVITYALKRHDAYTFPQWQMVVSEAFNDDLMKPHKIEWIWCLHDYENWIAPHRADKKIHEFKSEVYHFRMQKSAKGRQVDCFYAMHDYCANARYGGLYPKPPQPPLRWLLSFPKGKPEMDRSAGAWYSRKEKAKDGEEEGVGLVDRVAHLDGIRQLLQYDSNAATALDIAWWEEFFAQIPIMDNPVPRELISWEFAFPDVKEVRKRSPAEAIDATILDDVEPEIPPAHELIVTKTWTATMKKRALEIESEERDLHNSVVQLRSRQFVLFLIDDEWKELGKEQTGLPENALNWGFLLGQIVRGDAEKVDSIDDVEDAEVTLVPWYPANGDPTGTWLQWLRKPTVDEFGGRVSSVSAKSRSGSAWAVSVPRTSVVLVDPEFNKTKGAGRRKLSANTLKKLLRIPEIDYCYLNNETGMITKDEATALLEQKYKDLQRSRSSDGRTQESKALSNLTAHKRCLDYVQKNRKLRKKARLDLAQTDCLDLELQDSEDETQV